MIMKKKDSEVDVSSLDEDYSQYDYTELQLKLEKSFSNLKNSMRVVGDWLETNRHKLKGKNIRYSDVAKEIGRSEYSVYSAVQKLQKYNNYPYTFHPTRQRKFPGDKFGAFRFSTDDYSGWEKENDIRERVLNKRIIVLRKSREDMFPKFKEKIVKAKLNKIEQLKQLINKRQKSLEDEGEYTGEEEGGEEEN